MGSPKRLCAGPLWAPLGLVGWALVGRALLALPWALVSWALVGRALVNPPGPLWADTPGALWAPLGSYGPPWALMAPLGIYIRIYVCIYIYVSTLYIYYPPCALFIFAIAHFATGCRPPPAPVRLPPDRLARWPARLGWASRRVYFPLRGKARPWWLSVAPTGPSNG